MRSSWPLLNSGTRDWQVEIVYHLFDLNSDGNLSSNELVAVLEKREASTFNKQSNQTEQQSVFRCLYACAFER